MLHILENEAVVFYSTEGLSNYKLPDAFIFKEKPTAIKNNILLLILHSKFKVQFNCINTCFDNRLIERSGVVFYTKILSTYPYMIKNKT